MRLTGKTGAEREGVMAAGGRARRFTLIGLSVVLVSILLGLGILFGLSAGRPGWLRDADGRLLAGSISEKIHVENNGVRQGMFIKSRNPSNPVLLFLHGGTGILEYFLSRQYPTGFEDYMTVVWWDRRGAWLSYDASAAVKTLTSSRSRTPPPSRSRCRCSSRCSGQLPARRLRSRDRNGTTVIPPAPAFPVVRSRGC